MPTPIEHVVHGVTPITAELQNHLIDTTNLVSGLEGGGVEIGPGGMTIPKPANTQAARKNSFVVDAFAEDLTSTFVEGELVAIVSGAPDESGGFGNADMDVTVTVAAFSDSAQGPMGVIDRNIVGSNPGRVVVSGVAWMRVVRPVDDVLLATHGVIRAPVLDGDTGNGLVGIVTFGLGIADVIYEWEPDPAYGGGSPVGTDEHWALVKFPPKNSGAMFAVATSDEGGGVVSLKFADADGTAHGEEITLNTAQCEDIGS